MKKFLIFLVSIVVVVCMGLTTFYFLRNDEVISIEKKEIHCNAGDIISLESLGITIKKDSKKTTFDYNAGGEEVTKFINYDAEKGGYVVSGENAGDVTLVISTTNKNYSRFEITVHIGNGTIEHPYFVFSEAELNKMGNTYRLDSHYNLMNDVALSDAFVPVGTDSATGFAGSFNGNGYTISGLNLANPNAENVVENAGLFTKIASTGTVYNLKIDNSNINGYYTNAGVLAGTVEGTVDKVVVTNATITNLRNENATGALAGKLANAVAPLKMSYAEKATIVVGNSEVEAITSANVGGLVGVIDKSEVKACYANEVSIVVDNATANAGGFVGKFVIGPKVGSIQQSYSNTTSEATDFVAFVNTIEKDGDFSAEGVTMLRHLIGNFAIVQNKTNAGEIVDADLVKNYDTSYFKNVTYPGNQTFFDEGATQYMVRGFASVKEVLETNEYVFFAIDSATKTMWDTEYVWSVTNTQLPTLRMGAVNPADPTSEYFLKNLEEKEVSSNPSAETGFITLFKGKAVSSESFKLAEDIDLSEEKWIPATIENSILDGQGKTITIKLGASESGNVGLFSLIKNSTIKNLNIVVVSVDDDSTDGAGALASLVQGMDGTTSSIENVNVTYQTQIATSHKSFGGLVARAQNTTITNCSVDGLNFADTAVVETAGGAVAVSANNSKLESIEIKNSNIKANADLGGIVAVNSASILKASGNYTLTFANNSNAVESGIGGVAGLNKGTIEDVNVTVKISINKADAKVFVGGVAGKNIKTIINTTVSGDGIEFATENLNVDIIAGGLVGENLKDATIQNSYNYLSKVGTYVLGKNYTVGGLTAINSGKITKAVAQSSVYGNKVAGITVEMKEAGASIDQVLVGVQNKENNTFTQNEIKGDKYVAGVAVDFRGGSITNIQAVSKIVGVANNTRSSLVVLIFPNGAKLQNATIDSSITGNGTKYRETWTDFTSYNNKSEFGYGENESLEKRFNLYGADTWHGSMQSVVINTANDGVSNSIAAMGEAFAFSKDYSDTSESSYIKYVETFKDVTQFEGSFEFTTCTSAWLNIEHKATRDLTFGISTEDVPDVWMSNNGICLSFLVV